MKRGIHKTWYVICPMCPTETNKTYSSLNLQANFFFFFNHMSENWPWLSLKGCIQICYLSRPCVHNGTIYVHSCWSSTPSEASVADLGLFLSDLFPYKAVQCSPKPHQSFADPSSPRLVYTSPSADLCPAFFSLRLLHCPLEASNASPPKVLWCYCLKIQILLTESFTSLLSQPYVFCWNGINWTGTEDKLVISRSLYLKIQI